MKFEGVTLITTTGCRPWAFKHCEDYMRRQTFSGSVFWIVVDDGREPQPVSHLDERFERRILRPKPYWANGENTLGRNLRLAVSEAQEQRPTWPILVIEDDDWYAPDWIERLVSELEYCDLAGEAPARYYNVASRCHAELSNRSHACLRATGMCGEAVKAFERVIAEPNIFYDVKLFWVFERGRTFEGKHTVGLKGLPGRDGLTQAHRRSFGQHDEGGVILGRWLGEDSKRYVSLYKEERKLTQETVECEVTKAFTFPSNGRDRRYRNVGDKVLIPADKVKILTRLRKVKVLGEKRVSSEECVSSRDLGENAEVEGGTKNADTDSVEQDENNAQALMFDGLGTDRSLQVRETTEE